MTRRISPLSHKCHRPNIRDQKIWILDWQWRLLFFYLLTRDWRMPRQIPWSIYSLIRLPVSAGEIFTFAKRQLISYPISTAFSLDEDFRTSFLPCLLCKMKGPQRYLDEDNWKISIFSCIFPFTRIFAQVSCPSCDVTWMSSNGFLRRSLRRTRKPKPAETTSQNHLLYPPPFQHPNPTGTCHHWIYVMISLSQPCLHGSLADGCWVYKSFPDQ